MLRTTGNNGQHVSEYHTEKFHFFHCFQSSLSDMTASHGACINHALLISVRALIFVLGGIKRDNHVSTHVHNDKRTNNTTDVPQASEGQAKHKCLSIN